MANKLRDDDDIKDITKKANRNPYTGLIHESDGTKTFAPPDETGQVSGANVNVIQKDNRSEPGTKTEKPAQEMNPYDGLYHGPNGSVTHEDGTPIYGANLHAQVSSKSRDDDEIQEIKDKASKKEKEDKDKKDTQDKTNARNPFTGMLHNKDGTKTDLTTGLTVNGANINVAQKTSQSRDDDEIAEKKAEGDK